MKILLVITKAEIGGAQTSILTLARGFKKCGNEIYVAFGDGDFLPIELKKEGIPFFCLKNLKRNKNPLSAILFIFELKSLIDKERFDVIHFNSTNTLPGVFSAILSRGNPKTIFTVHGLSILDSKYKASPFLRFLYKIYFKLFLNYIDRIIFVSKCNLAEAIKQKITTRGIFISNGLDIKPDYFLSRNEARNRLGELINNDLTDDYLIGSIGRLAFPKNYEFILNIWPEIKKIKKEAKLIIIGEGNERKKYEKIIKDFNIGNDVFLVGEIKNASRFLKALDLFVLPSIYEGLSISLIEVLFSGIPVLASDVGGNREVIGAENCFTLNGEMEFLEKLKKEVLVKTDKSSFTADYMVKEYIKIYEI